MYAQEQEALKRIDDQKVKLSAMLREADDMEAELEMKRQELEEVTDATCAIEEMKAIEMPDGRSLWEHNMARVREERERKRREEEAKKRRRKSESRVHRAPNVLPTEYEEQMDEQKARIERQVREDVLGRNEDLTRRTLAASERVLSKAENESEFDFDSIRRG